MRYTPQVSRCQVSQVSCFYSDLTSNRKLSVGVFLWQSAPHESPQSTDGFSRASDLETLEVYLIHHDHGLLWPQGGTVGSRPHAVLCLSTVLPTFTREPGLCGSRRKEKFLPHC